MRASSLGERAGSSFDRAAQRERPQDNACDTNDRSPDRHTESASFLAGIGDGNAQWCVPRHRSTRAGRRSLSFASR